MASDGNSQSRAANGALDDMYFRELASHIGKEWLKLATFLNFSRASVERLQLDYHPTEERIFQMLVSWRCNSDWRRNNAASLQEALRKCGRGDLADQLQEECLSRDFSHTINLSDLSETNVKPDEGSREKAPSCAFEQQLQCDCNENMYNVTSLKELRAEFHRRFTHLRGTERLGCTCRLVDFVAGYFGFQGGTLSLPEYDVLLYIPRGAIPPGIVQEVYLYVNPLVQSVPGLLKSRALLSPLVECGPTGLSFRKSVVLHIPHVASSGGAEWDISAAVSYSESEHTHSGDWNNFSPEENRNLIINEQQLILALDHFSTYALFGTPASKGCAKAVRAFAFCPVSCSATNTFRFCVLIWNDTSIARQCVIRRYRCLPFAALDQSHRLSVKWDGGDLMMEVEGVRPGFRTQSTRTVCITEEELWEKQMHAVTFDLALDSTGDSGAQTQLMEEPLCDVQICQSKKGSQADRVRLPVCPTEIHSDSFKEKSSEPQEQVETKRDVKSSTRRKQYSKPVTKDSGSGGKTTDKGPEPSRWELCTEYGNKGRVDITTNLLRSITAYRTGEIVIADFGNNRVVISDTKGFRKDVMRLERVWDVAVLPNDYLVVVDETSHVKVFTDKREPAFQFMTLPAEEIGKRQVGLVSTAIGANGNIFIGDAAKNVVTEHLGSDGTLVDTRQLTICPHFMAVNSQGHLLVSGWNVCRVDIMDDHNVAVQTVRPCIEGKEAWCLGVCCDSKDDIFLVVTCDNDTMGHVHQYSASGVFRQCIVKGLHVPRGVVCVEDTKLAVANDDTVLMFRNGKIPAELE